MKEWKMDLYTSHINKKHNHMGLFSFTKKDKPAAVNFYANFSLDIRNLDKQFFHQLPNRVAGNGDELKVYKFNNPINDFGFFNELEFIEFPNGNRNVFFISKGHLTKDKVFALGFLIDTLISYFGKDDSNRGKFEAVKELGHMEIFAWSGRAWTSKAKPGVMLDMDDDFTFILTIYSPN